MATIRETKVLSNPTVYLDGRKLKVIPNSVKAELPGEVKSRAVSSGGGGVSIVHGFDVEASVCMVKFDVANTAENIDIARDSAARRKSGLTSTLRIVEDTAQMIYTDAMQTNKPEIEFSAEGNIPFEYSGLFAGS